MSLSPTPQECQHSQSWDRTGWPCCALLGFHWPWVCACVFMQTHVSECVHLYCRVSPQPLGYLFACPSPLWMPRNCSTLPFSVSAAGIEKSGNLSPPLRWLLGAVMTVEIGRGCHLFQAFLLVSSQAEKGSSRLFGDADSLPALKAIFCFTVTEKLF